MPGLIHSAIEPIWKGKDSFYGKVFNTIKDVATQDFSDPSSIVGSFVNKETQAGPTGRDIWQAERDDSAFQRQVSDMQSAGLNPAMMYGGSSSPVVNTSSSSSPGAGISDLLQLAMLPLQIKSLEADIAKKEEDTKGVNLDNEFKEQTLSARAEAVNLANSLTRSQTNKLDSELDQIVANTNKLAEEAKSEESKRELNFASALLSRINAYTAVELLPYSQMLAEAQTEAQKNYASLMAVQTLYQRKLINGGYIDSICEQMKASATSTEAKAAVDKINSDIRAGKFGNDGSFLGKVGSSLLQGTVLALDQLKGIASVGLHFGKNLGKKESKSEPTPISGNYDPFGYLSGE